ncbi:MAG: hypothetical protein F4Y94_04520 [Chloroflexi bacterium]|nr:hypothetical protein [Chloroflexota bacterium]
MSVDRAGIQQQMAITLRDGAGVSEFRAAVAQELGQETVADPNPETDPGNAAHALVIGKKTPRIKRRLRDNARFKPRAEIPGAAHRDR